MIVSSQGIGGFININETCMHVSKKCLYPV